MDPRALEYPRTLDETTREVTDHLGSEDDAMEDRRDWSWAEPNNAEAPLAMDEVTLTTVLTGALMNDPMLLRELL